MSKKPDDKTRKGNWNLSLDDLKLWKRFTHDIDPLHEIDWGGLEDRAEQARETAKKKEIATESAVFMAPLPPPSPNVDSSPQLDRRTEEKLRRGQLPIDGRIDLHGLTQDRAHDALCRFIEGAAARGHRCVLVITGKGRSSHADDQWIFNDGILRARLPEWLSSAPMAQHVLKHIVSQPKDGGEGAYYVYLRRRR